MKKTRKLLLESIFRKSSAIIAALGLMIALVVQVGNFNDSSIDKQFMINERSLFIQRHNDSLLKKIVEQTEIIKAQMEYYRKDSIPNDLLLNEKLRNLDLRLSQIEEQTKGLRQAINPLNPDEILTIARLNDGLNIIVEKQINSAKTYEEKFESFKTSIIRELDASSKSINWLFLVLIPIVMNLLYSMWKDAKEKKAEIKKNINE